MLLRIDAHHSRTALRGWSGLILLLNFCMAVAPALALTPAPETGDCSLDGASPATIAAVDDDFSILLDDGRRASLAGLDFPGKEFPGLREAALSRLTTWLTGAEVFFGAFGPAPDRWDRSPGRIFAAQGREKDAPLILVAAALLEEGLARFRPDLRAASCATTLLGAEATGRAAGKGVWAQPQLKVVAATDRVVMAQRKGMVVVEGEIRSVGRADRAIYLNFDDKKLEGFAVVISRRNLDMFAAVGIDATRLVGRRARVRGLIETGFGPRIEISNPAEIELIDGVSRQAQ